MGTNIYLVVRKMGGEMGTNMHLEVTKIGGAMGTKKTCI